MSAPPRKIRILLSAPVPMPSGSRPAWDTDAGQQAWWVAGFFSQGPETEVAGFVFPEGTGTNDALPDDRFPVFSTAGEIPPADVLVTFGQALPPDWIDRFREGGGRVAQVAMGQHLPAAAERIIFNRSGDFFAALSKADAVWTFPGDTEALALSRLAGAPVLQVPRLWTPFFLEPRKASANIPFGYVSGKKRWRLCISQENSGLLKNFVTPFLVLENAHRAEPRLIGEVHIARMRKIRSTPGFAGFMKLSALHAQGYVTLWNDEPSGYFLGTRGDCLVAHGVDDAPPNVCLEALHGNYPLIHNFAAMSELGCFYEGFDALSGAKALVRAFETHDQSLAATASANRRFLDQFSPDLDSNREPWLRAMRFLQEMPSKTG
jgi:hypothetical protein